MLKINLCPKTFKFTKKNIINATQNNPALFLTKKAKKLFQKLKKAFCEKFVLQHFDLSKLIKVKTDVFGKIIDVDNNWYLIANYLYKMV